MKAFLLASTILTLASATLAQEPTPAEWWAMSLEERAALAGNQSATPSVNGTVVKAGSGGSITDSLGNAWTIAADATVQKNGKAAGYSKDVTQLVYVNGVVWQQNQAGLWWPWDGIGWPGYGMSTSQLSAPAAPASAPTTSIASATPSVPSSTAPTPSSNPPVPSSPAGHATTTAVATAPTSIPTAAPQTTPVPAPCPANAAAGGTGAFYVSNGQIIGPDGKPFIARGINIMHGNGDPSLAQMQAAFPGVNFIRLAIYNYDSPSALSSAVTALTGSGIVVELEDHHNGAGDGGGNQGVVFTGSTLANELSWYQAIASAFAGNPYVWFGTNNEPSQNPSAAALSQWQAQTVQAVRGTGNNNIVMIEMNCDGLDNACGGGYTASAYSGMTNVIWDIHYYNWAANYSTDQAMMSTQIGARAQSAQQITSGDGIMPVLIGEYGNSTSGAAIDPGGEQTVTAVINAGSSGVTISGVQQRLGSSAWAWGTGGPGDGLTTSDGMPSSPYGQQVQLYIGTSTVAPSACQVEQQAVATANAIQAKAPSPTTSTVTGDVGANGASTSDRTGTAAVSSQDTADAAANNPTPSNYQMLITQGEAAVSAAEQAAQQAQQVLQKLQAQQGNQ